MRDKTILIVNISLPIVFCGVVVWMLMHPTTTSFGIADIRLIYGAIFSAVIALLGIARSSVRIELRDILALVLVLCLCIKSDGNIELISKITSLTVLYIVARVLSSITPAIFKTVVVMSIGLCGIYQAIYGIGQLLGMLHSYHSQFSLTGTFFNPGPYGGFLAVALCTCLSYLAERKFLNFNTVEDATKTITYIISAICVALCCIVLPATLSRAAMVAVGGSIALLCVYNQYIHSALTRIVRDCKSRKSVIGAAVLILITFAILLFWIKRESAIGRLHIWDISFRTMISNPLGVGLGRFSSAFGQMQANFFANNDTSSLRAYVAGAPEYGFNDIMQIGVEMGLGGVILLLGLLIVSLKEIKKCNPLNIGLVSLLIFSFFSYPLNLIPFQIITAIFLGYTEPLDTNAYSRSRLIISGATMFLCGLLLFLLKSNISTHKTYRDWEYARRWFSMEFYEYVLEDYPHYYPTLKNNHQYLYEWGYALHKQGCYERSNTILRQGTLLSADPMFYNVMGNNYKELGEYDTAESCYFRAYYTLPNRIYPLYLLTKLYADKGDAERALEKGREFLNHPPKVISPATRELQNEIKQLCDSINSQKR